MLEQERAFAAALTSPPRPAGGTRLDTYELDEPGGAAASSAAAGHGLRMRQLRQLALTAGVTMGQVDDAYDAPDPRQALINAIVARQGPQSAGGATAGSPAASPADNAATAVAPGVDEAALEADETGFEALSDLGASMRAGGQSSPDRRPSVPQRWEYDTAVPAPLAGSEDDDKYDEELAAAMEADLSRVLLPEPAALDAADAPQRRADQHHGMRGHLLVEGHRLRFAGAEFGRGACTPRWQLIRRLCTTQRPPLASADLARAGWAGRDIRGTVLSFVRVEPPRAVRPACLSPA